MAQGHDEEKEGQGRTRRARLRWALVSPFYLSQKWSGGVRGQVRLRLADSRIKKWNECHTLLHGRPLSFFFSTTSWRACPSLFYALPWTPARYSLRTYVLTYCLGQVQYPRHARPSFTPHSARCLQSNRDHRLFLHHWNPRLFPYPLRHQALRLLCARLPFHTQHIPCFTARWSMGRCRRRVVPGKRNQPTYAKTGTSAACLLHRKGCGPGTQFPTSTTVATLIMYGMVRL